jgi:Kef-type K+ transport system membrane component KefB
MFTNFLIVADFGSIILLSLFFSGKSSTSTAGRLILLGIFGLVVLVGVAVASAERSMSLSRVLRRLQDTTAQIRVRAAFLLLIGFTALAVSVGLETILGAFAAGALLSLLDRDEKTTHPQFRLKLEAVGFGVFIPIFFVTSGLTFDLNALFASGSTIARVPVFLLAILLARGLPALVYVRMLGLSRSLIAGILQATSLPFIVAATQIGLQLGVVSRASAAGLVAAGLLSVVISPALGLGLLRRQRPETATARALPTPVMPVLTAEDRALCEAAPTSREKPLSWRRPGRQAQRRTMDMKQQRTAGIDPMIPYKLVLKPGLVIYGVYNNPEGA